MCINRLENFGMPSTDVAVRAFWQLRRSGIAVTAWIGMGRLTREIYTSLKGNQAKSIQNRLVH
jgi:hypothetical protein